MAHLPTLRGDETGREEGAQVKRRTPLQVLWTSVECKSCADGSISVRPVWRGIPVWTPLGGGGPGLLTRMYAARQLARHLNAHLRLK
jgi:hypothetical protein